AVGRVPRSWSSGSWRSAGPDHGERRSSAESAACGAAGDRRRLPRLTAMGFLFDTDAISEVLKKKPEPRYLRWIAELPRAEQFTSAIVIGEMFRGAFRAADPSRHLENIESRILPAVTVLPYDVAVARVYGQ